MVTNGVSVYDVAQVFGDRDINSTKPYLVTDMEHLKMCALPIEGIMPGGGLPDDRVFKRVWTANLQFFGLPHCPQFQKGNLSQALHKI